MALRKLGEFIEPVERRNTDLSFGVDDVRGVSNAKQFMPTKADNTGRDLEKFYIVSPEEFVYNSRTTRMGEKVGLGYNNTDKTFITSWNNSAFRIKAEALKELLPTYLYMYYNRPEFDRYARYNSWGSSTELFSWDDMCDIDIVLPSVEIQQEYVDVYNSMVANQKAYEQGLEDLKLTCDAYIERLRKEYRSVNISEFIKKVDDKTGHDVSLTNVKGISINKEFIETKANMEGVSLSKYKIVRNGQFAFNINTARMGEKFAIALCEEDYCLVSAIYDVFKTNEKLLPEYLMMWLKRTEFDRYVRFHSWGSAREVYTFKDICDVQIPIPETDLQQSIVDIYKAYITRREINEKLKSQIKELCPILIKGSLEAARKA